MDSGGIGEALARLRAIFPGLSARSASMRAMLGHHASASVRLCGTAREALPGRSLPELATLEAIEDTLSSCLDAQDDALAEAGRVADALNLAAARIEVPEAQRFQSRKLEAIGELTGGIAHDFNNLLTVVTSGLQLLSRTEDPERRRRLTRGIEEAAWRGADLTRRLLAFARRQPLNPRRLELGPHIEGLRHLLCHGLREDIRILTNIQPGTWPVEADLAALELAVLNLGVNARDAMPNGGTMVLPVLETSEPSSCRSRSICRPATMSSCSSPIPGSA
jgi:signal transduction histidine kinase